MKYDDECLTNAEVAYANVCACILNPGNDLEQVSGYDMLFMHHRYDLQHMTHIARQSCTEDVIYGVLNEEYSNIARNKYYPYAKLMAVIYEKCNGNAEKMLSDDLGKMILLDDVDSVNRKVINDNLERVYKIKVVEI